jgi:hypothetical protein
MLIKISNEALKIDAAKIPIKIRQSFKCSFYGFNGIFNELAAVQLVSH